MAKTRIAFTCQSCGQKEPKWVGKCGACGEYNTYVEEVQRPEDVVSRPVLGDEAAVRRELHVRERCCVGTVCLESCSLEARLQEACGSFPGEG